LLLFVVVGITGAVSALGDTLFPASSLTTSIAQDFSSSSYYLLRLRISHPVIALVTVINLAWVVASGLQSPGKVLRRLIMIVAFVVFLQLMLGTLNVVPLAPVWLQIVHLFMADVLWITIVLLVAESLTKATEQ